MDNKFFILPKEIMNKKLSDGGKLLYALMLDRHHLSLENEWRDGEGRVYIYFVTNEIKKIMGYSNEKVVKLLAELEREGLIQRKRQGQGKPSVIYVNDLCSEMAAGKPKNKTSENRNSRHSETEKQEFRKLECNNTDNNNTDKSYTDNKSNPSDGEGWMEKRAHFKKRVEKNINYTAAVEKFGKGWCDEIVELITDTLISEREYIKIGGENYPAEAVKSRLLKINDMHLSYINDALSENHSRIRNIRSFLLTTIYRAPQTMENWYSAKVNYDMEKG